jgi:1,4-dihydroxy-2-naphthoate octaprenyltransferase
MKYFNLSLSTLIFRFYLMMAVIIAAGFSGLWFLCILALPIFFSAMMGIQFKKQHSIKKPDMRKAFDLTSDKHHAAH